MGKYKIVIDYDTGSSFGTEHGLKEYLPMSWDNLDIAKRNLKFIDAHYQLYRAHNRRLVKETEREELLKEASKQIWFNADYWEYQIMLLDDAGNLQRVSTSMWIGHFEKLNYAEIEVDKEREGMRIGGRY